MDSKSILLNRESSVAELIQQAPIAPQQHSHSYDDYIGILWQINEQYVQLTLEPKATQGRWLSWHPSEHPDIKNRFQYLDITKPETWQELFDELQSQAKTQDKTPKHTTTQP